MDIRYKLIFRGFKEDIAEVEAVNRLCKLFDLPFETIRSMFSRPGNIVESDLTLKEVARLQKVIGGRSVSVEWDTGDTRSEAESAA